MRNYELIYVTGAVCRVCGISEEMLIMPGKVRHCSEARAIAAMMVQASPALSLTSLGAYLKRNIASLGRSARRLAAVVPEDICVNEKISAVRAELARIAES